MTPPKRILVLDRGDVRQIIAELLVDLGYVVTLAEDAARMRAELETGCIDLIVLDATASDAEAITLANVARDRGVRLVMISGRPATMRRTITEQTSFSGSRLPAKSSSEL